MLFIWFHARNRTIPDYSRVKKMNLMRFMRSPPHHMLKAAVAFALDSARIKEKRSKKLFPDPCGKLSFLQMLGKK